MFSGIVETVGQVLAVEARRAGRRLRIGLEFGEPAITGESIATNGVCLTVVEPAAGSFDADLSEETLARTTLGELEPGSIVNLERSLRLGDRISGHFVFGHVDGVGSIEECADQGDGRWLRVSAPRDLRPYLVDKGSIALDGISLTMCDCREDSFAVAIVPHTLGATNLRVRMPGHRVNLEIDMLARYVRRALDTSR